MKDLRIVTVSWNVSKLLERCLASLPAACRGLDWEVVVVDNASKDDSVAVAHNAGAINALPLRVIANPDNRGFSKACNQGAQGNDARYILLLNPDTECPPGSLAALVQIADKNPQAAVIGPALQYPDGQPQPSVRRFPLLFDQVLIATKLSLLFPGALKKYLAQDIDQQKEQQVDSIMGACFLVRREAWDAVHGLDERYFIWFEEVDFCKAVIAKGWNVLYAPSVSVTHHLGKSFAQEFQPRRQRMFFASCTAYFQKWHGTLAAIAIRLASWFGLAIVWGYHISKQAWAKWFIIMCLVEAVSFFALGHSAFEAGCSVLITLVVFAITWQSEALGVCSLLFELLLASKGGLFSLNVHGHEINVRLLMTGAFLLAWGLKALVGIVQKKRTFGEFTKLFKGREWVLALYALVVYGVIRGYALGNTQYLYPDANAWFDLIVLFPIVDIATREGDKLKRLVVPLVAAGIVFLAVQTFVFEYLFSHGFAVAPALYAWVRKTGLAEVTFMGGDVFRIFMQSYIYPAAAWVVVFVFVMNQKSDQRKNQWLWFWFLVGSAFVLLVSLSRSFWIGVSAGSMVGLALILKGGAGMVKSTAKKLWLPFIAGIASIVLFALVLFFPVPRVPYSSLEHLFLQRADVGEEAAAVSRWHLLSVLEKKIEEHPILGSGFGATVTYQSEDPRLVASNGGVYTTYAFEWGWIEPWIKFGILGIPIILGLLISLGWRIWRNEGDSSLRIAAVSTLVMLAVVHFFTPYLNHPLGFAFLFAGEALVAMAASKKTSDVGY